MVGKLISATEYAKKVGRDRSRIIRKLQNGDFASAQRIGNTWALDEDEPYLDNRLGARHDKSQEQREG